MRDYYAKVEEEVLDWKLSLLKQGKLWNRLSKGAQNKINQLVPEKAHKVVTESVKKMVEATLVGSGLTTKDYQTDERSFEEKEILVKERMVAFRKTATIEGAGTGAGGIFLGLADFPLLLSIKMKFLYETASIYGYDVSKYEERLFLLHVFQLAFSNENRKREVLYYIENWEQEKDHLMDMDWRVFQQEYRDYIDVVKLFQMIPGLGAIIGAYANYNLLDQLGETAMNCYRIRVLDLSHPERYIEDK
ncbi:EcsC family protein [Saliterribacillus persicus]|uniref:EcsC family protein n=1 Tax=Saliterribacillus persicus TaxID=930114 RepID=A0A368YDF3_9BACI|nr:EcsC family protein [Saliterribacillus persicus]RCW76907.1 EcsC family protein [Saliterribacillus persicus]